MHFLAVFYNSRTDRSNIYSLLITRLPQGCVLSPLLFVLYTNECQSQFVQCRIIKFADDSVTVSLLSSHDPDRGPVVAELVQVIFLGHQCVENQRDDTTFYTVICPMVINDQTVEFVQQY